MSSKTSSTNLLELFASNSPLTVCSYKEMGLMCFDGDGLAFVSVIPPKSTNEAAVFVRSSTIKFDYKLPSVDEITQILPSTNDRFIALVGPRCVFVTELPIDFWNAQSLFHSHNLENLRSDYTAQCEILNVNLVLSKRQYSVRKVVWMKGSGQGSQSSVLAVLYSNSLIRVYDVLISKSAPITVADFRTSLGCRTDETNTTISDGKRFGLVSELVSFDFGPCLKYNDSIYLTLFAVDSDGELFYSVNGTKNEKSVEPIGPINLEGRDSNRPSFYFNTTDLLFVNHINSSDVPVFAFCSDQGEMFHVVLVQTQSSDHLIERGKNVFQPTIVDSFQIEDWPLRNPNVTLLNDFDHRGEYFVVTATDVYLVNPNSWIQKFGVAMDEAETAAIEPIPDSEVRHYFKLVTSTTEPATAISAMASVQIEVDGGALDGTDLTLFVVLDSSPHATANFIQRKLKSKPNEKISKLTAQPTTSIPSTQPKPALNLVTPQLRQLPKISTSSLNRPQRLDAVCKAIKQTNEQLQVFLPHVVESQKKAEQLVHRFDHLDQAHKHCSDRLFKIFSDLHATKNKLSDIKQKRAALEENYFMLTELIESKIYTPHEAEDLHIEKLKESKKKCEKLMAQLQRTTTQLIEANARYASGTKSFVASASAQKFMLTKHAVEIAQLQNNVERSTRDLNSMVGGVHSD
ncbi:hypothetical protein M3Y94_00970200 [Aphelenchoides besseyi]|nr:hypothetical protein M3Y94_00970200 [Aphelenchoides besseyi]KAI6224626.1 hypothetical protein M3Y95_00772600 [Aphelenchoides besseyi]